MQQHIDLMLKGALIALLLMLTASARAEPGANEVEPGWQLAQALPQQGQPPAQTVPRAGGDAGLSKRVEQLEEQLVDMQVVVGTLQSLARSGAGAPSAPTARNSASSYYSGAESGRLSAIETQIRALTAQIEQIAQQVRALGIQPRRSDAGGARDAGSGLAQPTGAPSFGSTTVTAGSDDAIGGLIEGRNVSSDSVAALPPAITDRQAGLNPPGNPKQLYETAYGYLMQRDYGAAQAAFEDFLSRYPNDSLAGNAQYWLGEAYFVRGQFKAAAGAFLKGYQTYSGNARAPDSLLKLAMSLDRLGQKDAACSSYAELSTKFPNAPQNVKMRAKSERQRVGCP
ncbi:MAG: tol-pal system protein YbgF [Hyphomicrobium sp.]